MLLSLYLQRMIMQQSIKIFILIFIDLLSIQPSKGQRCQLVTVCHPGLTDIFISDIRTLWCSRLIPERQSA